MTAGLVLVLFVVYEQWWTHVLARQHAAARTHDLTHTWDQAPTLRGTPPPDAFRPGQGFAVVHIPKLGVNDAVVEGTDKGRVLDKGLVGHYDDPGTAMPWDPQGNFAIAGHRRTHGEPFRYVNKLDPGDVVVVETQSTYYTYVVDATLPQTTPDNIGVINPVPKDGPYQVPGRYITLTTCTPENASTYRLIVWGHLLEERPRTSGPPPALTRG